MNNREAAINTKKDAVIERLNKRHNARHDNLDVKLEQRQKESDQMEETDYISNYFGQKVKEIETSIENINDLSKCSGESVNELNLTERFANIMRDIQELQKYLTHSTPFLNDYKIKACQAAINELSINCENTRLRLIPKKKFGFSGPKVTPKALFNPKLSTANLQNRIVANDLENKIHQYRTIANWTLSDRVGEYIKLTGNEIHSKDITISNVKNCFIELQGHPGSVQISKAFKCIFLIGPVARAVFGEDCIDCTLCASCQQLRFHASKKCQIHLHVTGRAIIEDCYEIEIRKYNYDYRGIEEDFKASGLDQDHNNYMDIADFNWLSSDVPSPNWHINNENYSPIDWESYKKDFMTKTHLPSAI